MPRVNATVPPEAIRIEDEVWQEAFTRREPVPERRRRLRAIDGGGQDDWFDERVPRDERLPRREHVPQRDREPQHSTIAGIGDDTKPVATALSPEPEAFELPAATWLATSTAPPAADPAPTSYAGLHAETAPPVRRTVKIQGRGAERHLPLPDTTRRRPTRRPYERAGFRPDRLAMWAVVLGFLLVLVAIASGHG